MPFLIVMDWRRLGGISFCILMVQFSILVNTTPSGFKFFSLFTVVKEVLTHLLEKAIREALSNMVVSLSHQLFVHDLDSFLVKWSFISVEALEEDGFIALSMFRHTSTFRVI